MPQLRLSRARLVTGKNATDAKGEDVPLADHGSGFWSLPVAGRCRVHLIGDWLTRSPKLFAGDCVKAKQHLFFALACENISPAVSNNRRRMAYADCDFPFLLQGFGPNRRKRGSVAIAVGSTPLRPILSPDSRRRRQQSQRTDSQKSRQQNKPAHL